MPSNYYNPIRRRNLYSPESKKPYRISRSKIENFIHCPRCFYLDRRLGVNEPQGYPFNLNKAVDTLLKKEFDVNRALGVAHPLMTHYGIDAVPFAHKKLDEWRENFKGICALHATTNLFVCGAVDDIWKGSDGSLIVVDYKATAKEGPVSLDAPWQDSYKRQMEIYQWLLRQNGFVVSETGYFVYVNGRADREAFDGRIECDISILPYRGKDDWIAGTLACIKQTLDSDILPTANDACDYCAYRTAAADAIRNLEEKR
ncbi:MAG: PD-(D/E)XK nuclease family protein [Candidatus Vogelbacteria bacterium]|nr:PD-(D/E)XK nuclease family protein [Candidatus Vogelbacteria bacterium]